MITLIICIALAAILLFWLLFDLNAEAEAYGFIIILLLMLGGLGFGLACGLNTTRTEQVPVEKFSFAKTASQVLIETPSMAVTFTDAKTYNNISDSSKVFYEVQYNVYGSEISRNIIVK